jgi:hypothetical protein
MTNEEFATVWEQKWPLVVAKAWADPAYKERLKKDPRAVLQEAGLPLLPAVDAVIVAPGTYARATMCLPLPDKPDGFSVEELNNLVKNAVVAFDGAGTSCCC